MNIFVLDMNPKTNAKMYCDKHIVKMILESCQMLCNCHYVIGEGIAPYKKTHTNHPCTIWSRISKENYLWLLDLTKYLLIEYWHRYRKIHKSIFVYLWCVRHTKDLHFNTTELTPFAIAMPNKYKTNCPVQSYKNYYLGEKLSFCRWTRRSPPKFVLEYCMLNNISLKLNMNTWQIV